MINSRSHAKRIPGNIVSLAALFVSTAHACPDGELSFNFTNLDIWSAFAVFADFRGYKPSIDPRDYRLIPDRFPCTCWEDAVRNVADKHRLTYRVENRILYVGMR